MESAEKIMFQRTTRSQMRHYVAFCKQHAQLHCGPHLPAEKKLWEELWEQLNSTKGAKKSADKWRKLLSKWKYSKKHSSDPKPIDSVGSKVINSEKCDMETEGLTTRNDEETILQPQS